MKAWILKKRWRIILAGILIVAAPLLWLAALVDLQMTSTLKDRIIMEAGWFSTIASNHIEDRLRGDINLGKVFVTRPYLLAGLRRGDKNEMSKNLKNLVDDYPLLDRAFITTPKGLQVANYPETPQTIGEDFSDRDWYKGVSENWTPHVSEFYMRAAEPQRYLFAIAIPMRLEEDVKGILVMQPKADYIKDALSGIEIGEGHIYVVDRKGHLIYHSEQAIDRIIDFSGVSVVQKVVKGEKGVEKIIDPVHKEPVISAYHPVKEWGWGVIVEKPVDVILAPVKKIRLSLFGFTWLLLILGGFFAYRFSEILVSVQKLKTELQQELIERKQMENEIAKKTDELRKAQDKLIQAEKLAALGRLTSDVAHEIRNPLTALGGFAHRLSKIATGAKERGYTDVIVAEVEKLEKILKNVLTFSRDARLHLERHSVGDIVRDAAKLYSETCIEQSIDMKVKIGGNLPQVLIDRDQGKQALSNLIANAIDAMLKGGTLTIAAGEENLHNVPFVFLKVSDTGEGIPSDKLPRIFEPFFTTKEIGHGTGLGLSISRKIIEEHGGFISAESMMGQGSTFSLYFPYQSGEESLKVQCWEYMKCGRERDATMKCPSYPNFGRICWVVAGTFCEGKVQGTYAQKYEDCKKCEFYRKVEKKEI
ncbi:MAG: ATP-binding protein [Nitrospirae bacterium]|nr:ATP-binding protein [Nitrospirota bacterium]